MGELVIRCPKTGRRVTTGIHIEHARFLEHARFRSMPVFFSFKSQLPTDFGGQAVGLAGGNIKPVQ